MIITVEKTKYHKYAFSFDYSVTVLDYCKHLKDKYGWEKFSFSQGKWRFLGADIIIDLKQRFPEIGLDPESKIDFEIAHQLIATKNSRDEGIDIVKALTDTNFRAEGIKTKLYPYQQIGVQFFLQNGGRGYLADDMGCLSGDTLIRIGRKKSYRRYTLKEAYNKFNEKTLVKYPSQIEIREKSHLSYQSKLLSYNEKKKLFYWNEIQNIIYNGSKEVFRVTAISDKMREYNIKLTLNHPLLTDQGWKEVDDIEVGSLITVINNFGKYQLARVVEIVSQGMEDVYDIKMNDPWHNFLANDIIVHNSGKSIQTLAYITHTQKKRNLIICPSSVKWSWYEEVKKHTHLKPVVINSKSPIEDLSDEYNVTIINYDILGKFLKPLQAIKFDTIAMDEAQYIKAPNSLRTKRVRAITKGTTSVILLSGTPILSRPVEIFTALNMLDPYEWNNYYSFVKRYCDARDTRWGLDVRGSSNIPELQKKISRYFLRRTKEEILPDLPPKNFIKYPVELETKVRARYDNAMDKFVEYLKKTKRKKNKEIASIMKAEKLVKLGELRTLTTEGKLAAAEELIKNILESTDEKIILFSNYVDPLKKMHEKFKSISVLLTGESSDDDRRYAKDMFQNNSKIRLFIGGIRSAGVGITLTQASNVVFLDYAWNPADHAQAIDRARRIGSVAKQINIYQLYALNSIDEYMTKVLEAKQEIFDQLINGGGEAAKQGKMMKELIKSIEDTYEIF